MKLRCRTSSLIETSCASVPHSLSGSSCRPAYHGRVAKSLRNVNVVMVDHNSLERVLNSNDELCAGTYLAIGQNGCSVFSVFSVAATGAGDLYLVY